jgi:hypothetical protein
MVYTRIRWSWRLFSQILRIPIDGQQTGNPKSSTMGPWSRGKRHRFSQKGHGPAVKLLGFPVWPVEMENFAEMTFINCGSKSVSWWEHFWGHLLSKFVPYMYTYICICLCIYKIRLHMNRGWGSIWISIKKYTTWKGQVQYTETDCYKFTRLLTAVLKDAVMHSFPNSVRIILKVLTPAHIR